MGKRSEHIIVPMRRSNPKVSHPKPSQQRPFEERLEQSARDKKGERERSQGFGPSLLNDIIPIVLVAIGRRWKYLL